MLVNIKDNRKDQTKFLCIEAVIEPMYYDDDDLKNHGLKFTLTDDTFTCEWKNNISVYEAIEWANSLKFDVELFLYNIGGSGFDGIPVYGSK